MKILKPGRDIKTWRKITNCTNCLAQLEIEASDLVLEAIDPREPPCLQFTCGYCEFHCFLTCTSVPDYVRHEVTRGKQ